MCGFPDFPHLSIIVVNFNAGDYLLRCLASIPDALHDVTYEVIVVDNASSDGSAYEAQINYPGITLITSDRNLGFSAANNIALRQAKGDYYLLLNPDTVLPNDGLTQLLRFMEDHKDVGMVGPKLVRGDGIIDKACRRMFPTRFDIILRLLGLDRLLRGSKRFGHYNMTYQDDLVSCDVDCVSGAFMLVRREAAKQVGALDERFFLYAEDLDWAYRYRLVGWRVYYYADVVVTHYKRISATRYTPQTIDYFYKSGALLYRKYYGEQSSVLVNLFFDLTIFVRWSLARLMWSLTKTWK